MREGNGWERGGEGAGCRPVIGKILRAIYYEAFDHVRTAIDREKQIKSWRREKKIALIEKANPRWKDLAEHWGWEMLLPGQSIKKNP